MSYALFLLTNLRGLGDDSTQARANRNLRREIAETSSEQRVLALWFTDEMADMHFECAAPWNRE